MGINLSEDLKQANLKSINRTIKWEWFWVVFSFLFFLVNVVQVAVFHDPEAYRVVFIFIWAALAIAHAFLLRAAYRQKWYNYG